ncbi:aminoglycoside phosphotransferase family protein [Carnobacterium maltaromaticum]|uniref:aminoglycoside phosphotransferase family protein n=1 Tax=Carnobacterium maltaromaticum TaxID=2751 RepID=UPI001072206A|nr:aminoglycoside phosphotransferase family protein [Carnobacterium maltaromaticum]TFJ77737.1 acetyltransferase [Carnobacterium maltaromaticum]TFJ79802.1 acetyltransferase [Carnobacterium maltaromaticum]
MDITVDLVKKLIFEQFPQCSHLEIKPVKNSGHDNRTFHLGDDLTIRLPSGKKYEPQIQKEAKWLPVLAQHLSLPITAPVAKGKPTPEYPLAWSINRWLVGETVTHTNVDLQKFAIELARFLKELEAINAENGPQAGAHNFYRGGDLAVYIEEFEQALTQLPAGPQRNHYQDIWTTALATKWEKKPVWVHGDIAVGNLLVNDGHLSGVIDFGILGTGDPACDLVIAWTFFDSKSRKAFKEEMGLDDTTWQRGKGWALWKALITPDDVISKKVLVDMLAVD